MRNPSTRWLSVYVLFAVFAFAPPVQAAKAKFERSKPHVNVGTIGHVDHGKTSLTAAISVIGDSKLRSSSTRPWENELCSGDARIAFSPFVNTLVKHSDFVAGVRQDLVFTSDDMTRFLLSGTSAPNGISQMDGAILVVSAADGPMPQTREHVLLARQVGVPAPIVYLDVPGYVEMEDLERSTAETIDLLVQEGYDPADIVVLHGDSGAVARGEGSADDVASVEQVIDAVLENVPVPEKPADQPFLQPIEDVFSITGRGTVVTGTIARGTVAVGDTVEVVGGEATNRAAVVEEIVIPDGMLPQSVDEARAGDAVELLLAVDLAAVGDGMVVAERGRIVSIHSASVKVYVLTEEEGGSGGPIHHEYRPQFFLPTRDVTGTVSHIEGRDELAAGSIGTLDVDFDLYVPKIPGASISICDPATGRTSAVGMIID